MPDQHWSTGHTKHRCVACECRRARVQRRHAPAGQVDGIECWEEADATAFCVRGRDYMQTRAKVPSAPAIYRRVSLGNRTSCRAQPVMGATAEAFVLSW